MRNAETEKTPHFSGRNAILRPKPRKNIIVPEKTVHFSGTKKDYGEDL
jgi:hypothetical protein